MSIKSDNISPIGGSQEKNENTSAFAERLNLRMAEMGISQADLSKLDGVSRSSASKYCLGERMPSADIGIRLAKRVNLNPEYLFLGTGAKEPEFIQGKSYQLEENGGRQFQGQIKGFDAVPVRVGSWRVALPLVDLKNHTGLPNVLDEIVEDYFIDNRVLSDMGRDNITGLCIGISISDAMTPIIPNNSPLIIDTLDKTIREGVFVFKYGDYLQVKRLRPIGKSSVEIICDNLKYQPEIVDNAADLTILGRVIKGIVDI